MGFHDVDYHSGEPYSGTDWESTGGGGIVHWTTDPFDQAPDANALRWGTLYNFRYDADAPPVDGDATITLFRPGAGPGTVTAATIVPGGDAPCPADIDGDGQVSVPDLLAVLTAWGSCPGCPEDVNNDDEVDVIDLLIVLSAWGPC